MSKKAIKELCKMAEAMGHTVEHVEIGKHYKVYLDTPAGKKILTVSLTASDRRACKNNQSIMRGWR